MDGDAQAEALLSASEEGAPFCEECEKLAADEAAADPGDLDDALEEGGSEAS